MTCKDCFHFEVCDSGRHIGEYIEDDGVYSEGVEKECLSFKNKADFVEVIRCKDCKYYERPSIYDEDYYCMSDHTQSLYSPNKNDFCSYGKRRDT